jgi:hypothetical protein
MRSPRVAFSLVVLAILYSGAAEAKCKSQLDPDCNDASPPAADTAGPAPAPANAPQGSSTDTGADRGDRRAIEFGGGGSGNATDTTTQTSGKVIQRTGKGVWRSIGKRGGVSAKAVASDNNGPLQPVRAYLRARDIPPAGVGAYGLVVFHSRPTPANRAKLLMVCKSFVAYFPRSEEASAPISDQMMTIWPVVRPDAPEIQKDDCDYAIDHYDLVASESAISDATIQHGKFGGPGPFLVGWSPSNARTVPGALVLVIDMSKKNTQAEIDQAFQFWKNEIVEDPSKWRNGWSVERIRVSLQIFADTYGPAMMDSVKFFSGKVQ